MTVVLSIDADFDFTVARLAKIADIYNLSVHKALDRALSLYATLAVLEWASTTAMSQLFTLTRQRIDDR
jgi:hypothetical protein